VVEKGASRDVATMRLARFAFAAAARTGVQPAQLDTLWRYWDDLPLSAQVATARALEANAHPAANEAKQRLIAATVERGGARSFRAADRQDAWMGSNLREQCSLIALLDREPGTATAEARRALVAGLMDLYGGTRAVDTQSGAICLMALQDAARDAGGDVSARVELGAANGDLTLAAGERNVQWSAPLANAGRLRIAPAMASLRETPTGFIAELRYEEDARVARASAIGLAITRRYAVFRDGKWQPLKEGAVREGEWVRITLAIDNGALAPLRRHHRPGAGRIASDRPQPVRRRGPRHRARFRHGQPLVRYAPPGCTRAEVLRRHAAARSPRGALLRRRG